MERDRERERQRQRDRERQRRTETERSALKHNKQSTMYTDIDITLLITYASFKSIAAVGSNVKYIAPPTISSFSAFLLPAFHSYRQNIVHFSLQW